MKKYFQKGTVILLKNLDDAIQSKRNAPMAIRIVEDMKKTSASLLPFDIWTPITHSLLKKMAACFGMIRVGR